MNYITIDKILREVTAVKQSYPNVQIYDAILTLEILFDYVSSVYKYDFCFSLKDYLIVARLFDGRFSSYRDNEGRPTIEFAGIKFSALHKEELEKYKVLE